MGFKKIFNKKLELVLVHAEGLEGPLGSSTNWGLFILEYFDNFGLDTMLRMP